MAPLAIAGDGETTTRKPNHLTNMLLALAPLATNGEAQAEEEGWRDQADMARGEEEEGGEAN